MTHELPYRLARFEQTLMEAARVDIRRSRRRRIRVVAVSAVTVLAATGFGATTLYPHAAPTMIAPVADPAVAARVASLAKTVNDCTVEHGAVIVKDRWGNLEYSTPDAVNAAALRACSADQKASRAYEQTSEYLAAKRAMANKATLVWACVQRHGYTLSRLATTNDPPAGYFTTIVNCQRDPAS